MPSACTVKWLLLLLKINSVRPVQSEKPTFPSLVPVLRCFLCTLKINISDSNPATHVGSSVVTKVVA